MIGVYVRVSTDEQRDKGHSIAAQITKAQSGIREKFATDEYTLYDDAGYSAKNLKRPAMTQLLHDIQEQQISTLFFYSLDRISRDLNDLMYFLHHSEVNNCELICITQDISYDTPEQRMFVLMQGVFAQFEREKVSERTKNGIAGGFGKGYYVFGRVPYGYYKVDKKLIINNHEADIVQKIFYLYTNQKWSVREICLHLQQRPVDMKLNFSYNTVYQLLNNTVYAGYIVYQEKVYNIIPPIISEKTFEHSKELMKSGIYSKVNMTKHQYLFKGKLVCCHCGKHLVGQSTLKKARPYLYYICTNKDCPANKKRLLEEKISVQLEELLFSLLQKFKANNKVLAIKQLGIDSMKKEYTNEISDRKKKINILNETLIEGDINQFEFRTMKKRYNNEIDYFQKEIELLMASVIKSENYKELNTIQKHDFIKNNLPQLEIDLLEKKVLI